MLGKLAALASWIVVPPACQDFYGDRNRAGRREMTVGRRMVFWSSVGVEKRMGCPWSLVEGNAFEV